MVWNDFCFDKEHPVYEMLTEEFVEALGNYTAERIKTYLQKHQGNITILEVGAGDGRLTHFLNDKLKACGLNPDQFKIVATDSGKFNIQASFPVEKLTYQEALQKHQPQMVLCSWMPIHQDWTKAFREKNSVQEYILIGEPEGGSCGDEWETWGIPTSPQEEAESKKNSRPPWEIDNFRRYDLEDIHKLQLARDDDFDDIENGESLSRSHTISFRRMTHS